MFGWLKKLVYGEAADVPVTQKPAEPTAPKAAEAKPAPRKKAVANKAPAKAKPAKKAPAKKKK